MSDKKNLRDSYLLCLLGFVGVAGIHRFYLGKPVSAFFYLITGGWFGIGTFIDLFTMPSLVSDANRQLYIERRLDEDDDYDRRRYIQSQSSYREPAPSAARQRPQARSLEHLMFILAEENQGVLTAAQLALESGIPAAQAQSELDEMVMKGFADHATRRNGIKVFVFREFLSDAMRADLVF